MQNSEEAAAIAAEFISSLDNLPNEVHHLLQEIRIMDGRCQDLQQEIVKEQEQYIRHALRQPTPMPSPAPSISISSVQTLSRGGGEDNPASTSMPPTSSSSPSTLSSVLNLAQLPGRIATKYTEMERLTDEKMALVQRIITLLTRTRNRLDNDLAKVRILQGESIEDIAAPSFSLLSKPSPNKRPMARDGTPNPVQQVTDTLKSTYTTPLGSGEVLLLAPSSIAAAGGRTTGAPAITQKKRRRLNTNTSIKLSSPSLASAVSTTLGTAGSGTNTGSTIGTTPTGSRVRPSRQAQITSAAAISAAAVEEEESLDQDAEGEEDVEMEDAEEDQNEYCFCRKQSYGDMIGCDDPSCPYQWFHVACVGVKLPLPDKWYCPECRSKQQNTGRKSRRK